MDVQYYQPQLELLLCRCRVVTADWCDRSSLREPFWRLYWHSGKPARLTFDGQAYELGHDTVALIAPETDYFPQMREPFDQFYIHFQAAYPFDACRQKIFTFALTPLLKTQLDQVSLLLQTQEQEPSRQLSLQATSLCLEALALIPDGELRHDVTNRKLIAVLDYMRRHYTAEIGNDELAELARMHKNAFIRFFGQHLGLTPQQYLRDLRIREACLLLRFSDKTIDEIAAATGFTDRFYFSRMFKKLRGITPAEFRHRSS